MLFQSETVTVEKDRDGSAFLKIDVPGQTHNVITHQVLADLDAALDAVAAEPRLPLLVFRSGKQAGFLAGADLHGFLEIADAAAAEALSAQGQRLFDKLAALPMPTLGRDPRPLSRRRPGTRPGLRLPPRPRPPEHAARLAGSAARPAARLGRHATVAAQSSACGGRWRSSCRASGWGAARR